MDHFTALIITCVLARNNRPCPSIYYLYSVVWHMWCVAWCHGDLRVLWFDVLAAVLLLLTSLIFLNVPRLNISAAYLYFSLCVQNILFLYIQFILSRSYSNIKNFFRLTITASCPMDLQYFPMDSQLCYIEIESCKYRRLCIAPAQPVYICRLYVNTAELQTKHLQILKILTNKIKIQLSNIHSIFTHF